MYFNETLAAGAAGAKEINEAGDFLRVLSAVAEDLTLVFYKDGREVGQVQAIGAGYSEQVAFDRVRVTSTAGGAVAIVTRMGARVLYDKPVGSVTVAGTITAQDANGAFTQAAATVNAATTQLLAANASRRYLQIQNNDAALTIYVTLDGTAATTAKGLKLGPGQSLEIQGRAPTGAINAINSSGSNTAVVVVEG